MRRIFAASHASRAGPPVPETPRPLPTTVAGYAAYLRVRTGLCPEVSVNDDNTVLTVTHVSTALTLVLTCRKNTWELDRIEASRDGQSTPFAQGERLRDDP